MGFKHLYVIQNSNTCENVMLVDICCISHTRQGWFALDRDWSREQRRS